MHEVFLISVINFSWMLNGKRTGQANGINNFGNAVLFSGENC